MIVDVTGLSPAGEPVAAKWTLDATTNLGPFVPVIPAWALIRRLRDGWRPEPGAYPCSGFLKLEELESRLEALGIGFAKVPAASPSLRAAAA